MAFSSYDRFDPVGQKHVDRLPHKGRNSRRHGSAPFATETGPATPSKADLQRGLSELGIKISPQQLDKLRSMGGAEVLKSIVTLGSGKDGAPPPAPSSRASQSATAPTRTQTGQTAHKNQSSVTGLLRMPVAEANRIVSSGDDIRDRDRVVTGLQSDRHRHFEHRQMGRKKTELHALRSLKACGPDPATVYKKLLQKNENGSKDILSKDGLRRGLTELAGVQLSPADLDAVVHKLDPKMSGKEGITLRQFSQILTKLPDNHRAKTSRQERQHHIDTINLTNRRAVDPVQVEVNSRAAVLAGIDAKLSKRFGTEPDRLRRLYMAMERNGDGTISASNLQNGMNRLGMSVSKDEFKTLMVTVQNVQRSVNAPPSGDDIYFSDLVHAFEREISPMDSQDFASLDFSNDHPRYNEPTDDHKRGYIHDEVTGLPSQMVHVEHHKKNNAFDELPQGKDKSKFRPTPHTSEYRKSIRLKSQLLAKLEEKGRSVADAFIALDSDRDGLVTNSDMRRGLMMNLGVQLSKTDLQCLVDHTVERENGITYQEFAHALQRDDKYHGYANDAKGSGGGGILEGPIAAAVGIDAVKHWTGRKEHRGQLSSAMTAKGTVSIGAQYADPHGVGVVGGNTSALEASATKAKQQQAGKQERRGNLIAARVGEHIRQRAHHVSDTFLDMDLQQHGSLSYVELRQGLDRIGVHLENDDFGLLINQLDKNGDGRVEFDEFARSVKGDIRSTRDAVPMTGAVLDGEGRPVRVGMVLSTTEKNNSSQVNEVLQMPPASDVPGSAYSARESIDKSWIEERRNIMSEGSPNKRRQAVQGPADDTLEDLSHVATRLKVRDTLTSKIGDTMREQYLSLHRDQKTNGVTVESLHRTLAEHGTDVTRAEVADLLVTAGVAPNVDAAMREEKIQFNDFKKLIHLTGLGDDVRAYDFARSVQIAPGVGISAGGLRKADRSEETQKWGLLRHVPKHLVQAAGGKRSHLRAEAAPRKRVTKNRNAETDAIAGLVGSNSLSIVHDDANDVGHNVGGSLGASSYLDQKHEGKHFNVKYRQHDHIHELGLLGGGYQASMGHDGTLGTEQHSHHGDGERGGRRHVIHGNIHSDAGTGGRRGSADHIKMEHMLEDNLKVNGNARSGSKMNVASSEMNGLLPGSPERKRTMKSTVRRRSDRKAVTEKINRVSVKTKTPRHLKSDDWFRHDSHLQSSKLSRKSQNISQVAKQVIQQNKHMPKVLRTTVRPPASPAARQAAEERASRNSYQGAAGVSASRHDEREKPGFHGRKHVPRIDNNLFQNMQYPNA